MNADHAAALAREKSRAMPALYHPWLTVAEGLAPLPASTAESLFHAFPHPRCGRGFLQLLAQESDPAGAAVHFLEGVDESDESLESWMAAMEVFLEHIAKTGQKATLTQAAGYLSCSISLIESGLRYTTFPQTVETMLTTYGFEGR